MFMIRLNEMAKRLNVSVKTLQRWDREGILIAKRTPTDRRYYTEDQYLEYIGSSTKSKRKTIAYVRVSSANQKDDLRNQITFIRNYVNAKGEILDDVIEDIGSGLNYNRKHWNDLLLNQIPKGEIEKIYITYKDRFVRFGFDWFERFCNHYNCEIVVINNPETLYIFAGDLLDRGIENDKVLQWAFDHAKDPNVIFIRGNHDVHLENWAFEALDENGDPIKLPHVFNYKTRPQLLGQKDYDQYEIGIGLKDDGLTYYTVNDQMTDIPVFYYKDKLVEKPRMTFRDGYVHLIDPYQVRHNTKYSTFTVDEFKLKKQARDLIRRFRDAVALEFHGRKYFINHAGISALPKMTFIPSFQLIRGVGKYETQIDEIWEESFQKGNTQGFIQVHGHRHTDSTEHSICLEDNVEYGGNLCVLHITKNGHSVQKYENTVFRIPQTDTESDATAKPWIEDTENQTTNSMIRNKHIRVKSLDHNLYSLNFTSRAFEKGIWDTETIKARGLFVDQTTGEIKMRSYNKFFAIGEQDETQISNLKKSVKFPLVAHKKYNGFLGIASTINGEFVIATKSTTDGEYVDYFREIFEKLTQKEKEQLKDLYEKYNCSFTFEVEHIADRHIIDFDKNSLTILDAIPNSFDFDGIDIDSAFSNKVLDQLDITSPFFKRKEVIVTWKRSTCQTSIRMKILTFEGFGSV